MSDNISLFFCGDVQISSHTELVDASLRTVIRSCDLAICNFEGPVVSDSSPNPKAGPHICQIPESVEFLKNVGFTHCSLANNHIYDYGSIGLSNTMETIANASLKSFGAGISWEEAYRPVIEKVNNTTIGLLAFCDAEFGAMTDRLSQTSGYAYINHHCVNEIIVQTKAKVDIFIVCAHAGIEFINEPLPEWKDRYRQFIELGADVVIGHHPHVPQGWELFNGKPIFYSLGNFFFNSKHGQSHAAKSFSVKLNFDENKFIDFEIIKHMVKDNKVETLADNDFDKHLNACCQLVQNNDLTRINALAVSIYRQRYEPYYESAILGYSRNASPFKKAKRIVYKWFQKNRKNKKGIVIVA